MASLDRDKLREHLQQMKDAAYDKGAAMVLASMARLGFQKLAVGIMKAHSLDLEHFEWVPPPDYKAIRSAWLHCGMPVKKAPIPTGRPKVSDPRHRQK